MFDYIEPINDNDEIKFKAYLKKENKIVDVKSIHFGTRKVMIGFKKDSSKGYSYGNRSYSYDDIVLMRYSGHHDKFCNEIYDGYKVRCFDNNEEAIVRWNRETSAFILQFNDKISDFSEYKGQDLMIFGNVYEY